MTIASLEAPEVSSDVPDGSSDVFTDTESAEYDSTDAHSDSEDSDTVMLKDTGGTTDVVDSASSPSDNDTATARNDSDSATASGDTATQDQQTDTAVTLVDGIVQLDGCDPDGWCAMELPGTSEGFGAVQVWSVWANEDTAILTGGENGEWSYVLQFNSKRVGSIWAAPDGALFVPVAGHILYHPGF